MYVLVLPVSGGGFVSQLAFLQHLSESGFVPDLTLASSGGNVAAYVGAASNWKWAPIQRIAGELNQEFFIKPWSSVSALSMIMGYFKGNIYDKGSGVPGFISRHFTPETISKYEIWTGTYNKSRQQARLFCNRTRVQSVLDIADMDLDLTRSMDPVFMNGDPELISVASIASASIPAVVPAQKIMNEDYIDGGIACASPLTIMQEPLLKHITDNDLPLHILYVNSVDLSNPTVKPIHNVLDTWRQATKDLVRSQTVIDRLSGYELLRCHPGTMNKEEFTCDAANLNRVKLIWKKVKYSMLEIYPGDNYDIDLVSFNGEDVVNAMSKAYKDCKCRLWWVSPSNAPDASPEITQILEECKSRSSVCDA